ncbi:MAG: phosphotransferase [Roseiflexaceae bacterium]|nr:phosphotransferase [Roseiflexaceae bacterium]
MVLLLPEPVRVLLQHAFPSAPLTDPTPTIGGFSNLTVGMHLNGIPAIVKAATTPLKRADLHREARILRILASSGLPIAPLITILENPDWLDWTVEVLGVLPGENGIQRLNDPPATLAHFYGELARLLARVHQLELVGIDEIDLDLPKRAEAVAAALPAVNLPLPLNNALMRGLARASAPHGPLTLVHGDPGAHNILWHHGISALLDWEWSGYGDSLTDIAWICWTLRFRHLPDSIRHVFLRAYGLEHPDPTDLRDLALAQIASILVRVADNPPARAEWLRRLEWTISLPEYY